MREEPLLAYVLTHHSVPNFGANLQAYATSTALRARGINAVFIDYMPDELRQKYRASVSKEQLDAHKYFIAKNLTLSTGVSTLSEFSDLCQACPADIYITGSDAVFRIDESSKREDLNFPNPYWLSVVSREVSRKYIKVALSPSAMGTNYAKLNRAIRCGIGHALNDFQLLSVRDPWTKSQLLGTGFKGQIDLVPDPVFSLADYIQSQAKNSVVSKPYIVLTTQGAKTKNWIESFTKIAEKFGYETVAVPTPEGVLDQGTSRKIDVPLDPIDWLDIHARSSGYVGARFHPVVVSLCAGVPVVSLDMYHKYPFSRRKSKTWLVMRDFGLSNFCFGRLVSDFVSPNFVWGRLAHQRRYIPEKMRIAIFHKSIVENWFNKILEVATCTKN